MEANSSQHPANGRWGGPRSVLGSSPPDGLVDRVADAESVYRRAGESSLSAGGSALPRDVRQGFWREEDNGNRPARSATWTRLPRQLAHRNRERRVAGQLLAVHVKSVSEFIPNEPIRALGINLARDIDFRTHLDPATGGSRQNQDGYRRDFVRYWGRSTQLRSRGPSLLALHRY